MTRDAIRTNQTLRIALLVVGAISTGVSFYFFGRVREVEAEWAPLAALYYPTKELYETQVAALDPATRQVLSETVRSGNMLAFIQAFADDQGRAGNLLVLGVGLERRWKELGPLEGERNRLRPLFRGTLVAGVIGLVAFFALIWLGREKPQHAGSLFSGGRP
jgi:hypothetical protein